MMSYWSTDRPVTLLTLYLSSNLFYFNINQLDFELKYNQTTAEKHRRTVSVENVMLFVVSD